MKGILLSICHVLGYLVVFLIVTVAVMGLTKWSIWDWESGDPRAELLGNGVLTTLGIALTNLLVFRLLGSKDLAHGWPAVTTGLVWFAKGGLCGLFMASVMVLLTIALGGASVLFESGALGAYVRYVIPLSGCLLVAALGEEWLFRGYPLTRLASALGRGWAVLLMSLLFAAAHLSSAGSNALVLFNIVIGSVVVGSLRFTPGGIPAAWGFHFVWNCTQALVGANLSIENLDVPGVIFIQSGPTIVSGGAFGPEAGIGATVSTVVVLALLFAFFRRQGSYDLPLPLGSVYRKETGR